MDLKFEKEASDVRGKIIFLSYGNKKLNIVQIKKGLSRGGHYHDFETRHFMISGIIEYRETNTSTNKETIRTVSAPSIITVPPMHAHLLTAIEDTIFAEEFGKDYSATEYPQYRKIVTQKMS
jgi:hypothetical protein